MPYEQKPNTGSLFPNSRKSKDTHPDFTGTLNVQGKLFFLDMWDNEAKGGPGPRFGIRIKPKNGADALAPASTHKPAPF